MTAFTGIGPGLPEVFSCNDPRLSGNDPSCCFLDRDGNFGQVLHKALENTVSGSCSDRYVELQTHNEGVHVFPFGMEEVQHL